MKGGITPAYAGQIFMEICEILANEDHPRIRGTNQRHLCCQKSAVGSPPHTRDKFIYAFMHIHIIGITPAYAGQIRIFRSHGTATKDHPRIRGTNLNTALIAFSYLGSPPHTRDKFVTISQNELHSGITPAYAGQII